MAYGRLWAPVEPNGAQWAFGRAKVNAPDLAEAKFAYDSLAYPLKGAGRSSYSIEMEPAVAEAYRRMLKRVTFGLDKAWIFAIVGGFGAGLGYLFTLRSHDGRARAPLLPRVRRVGVERIRVRVPPDRAVQPALPRGVRLTFTMPAQAIPRPGKFRHGLHSHDRAGWTHSFPF